MENNIFNVIYGLVRVYIYTHSVHVFTWAQKGQENTWSGLKMCTFSVLDATDFRETGQTGFRSAIYSRTVTGVRAKNSQPRSINRTLLSLSLSSQLWREQRE